MHSINYHDPGPIDDFLMAMAIDEPDDAIRVMNAAIERGADPLASDIRPLYDAAFRGHVKVVEHLLKLGCTMTHEWPVCMSADLRPDGVRGKTALHVAAERGQIEVLDLLLQQSDARRFLTTFTRVECLSVIGCAARGGHTECIRLLFRHGADPNLHDADGVGYTALDEAISNGHIESVRYLLSIGTDPDIPTGMQVTARQRAEGLSHDKAAIRDLIRATPTRRKPGKP